MCVSSSCSHLRAALGPDVAPSSLKQQRSHVELQLLVADNVKTWVLRLKMLAMS